MMPKLFPWIVLAAGAAWIASAVRYPSSPAGQIQVHEFGKLPVVYNGRVKPMDTMARNMLRIVSEKETFTDASGKRRAAIEWLMDVMVDSTDPARPALKHPVFRVVHPNLRDALGLEERERFRYSIDEFAQQIETLESKVRKAVERKQSGHGLDAFETQLLEFWDHLHIYRKLSRFEIPHIIPPAAGGEWKTFPQALRDREERPAVAQPHVEAWMELLRAKGSGDAAKFNATLAAYRENLAKELPKESRKAGVEAWFNHLDPFNKCKWLYFGVFVLACLGWLGWSAPLNRGAIGLLAFTVIVHTLALVGRIYLSGRPPVTNLYSSAIFIGWGCAIVGLIFERTFRLGVGNVVAGVAGFATLEIAHILAADGDTMEVLQAVLDTQFWLATHVTTITLGYSTTYIAGLIGIVYIIRGVLTPTLDAQLSSTLARMIYGTTCFAMFFSFVGTVLGGLWADDSWGRFWGWDPKENGALMIVLWNALLLHARWGGIARERGIAILAVAGNIIVSWSWFGVNLLGKGLHSYGFTEGRVRWLVLFILSQAAIIVMGCLPRDSWRSKLPEKGANAEGR